MVVDATIYALSGENEREYGGIIFRPIPPDDPLPVQFPGFGASQLEPIKQAGSRLNALHPGLETRARALSQLRERRAEIGRRQHDEMAHGAAT